MLAAPKFLARCGSDRPLTCRFLSCIFLLSTLIVGLSSPLANAQGPVVLVGSGSTVPAPLYNRWAQEYGKRKASIQMKYVPIGTVEGIEQITHGSGDFGAGESLLSAKERAEKGLIELPVVIIGIVPIYNLPDVHHPLRLSGEVLAEIFLGNLKTWNAPPIAKLNPDVTLPDLAIQVINRPAGKGSNFVLTDFLSATSPKFRERIGVTASPKWPIGIPAERSSDMAEKVKKETGSIGYVEYQYAVKGNISQASVLNPAGKFVRGSPQGFAAACEAVEAPRWNGFSSALINAPGADSFPITSFTWFYLRTRRPDPSRSAALNDFLEWAYSDGQKFAAEEGYTALPAPLLAAVNKKVKELR